LLSIDKLVEGGNSIVGQEIVVGSNVQPRAGTTLEQLSASYYFFFWRRMELGIRGEYERCRLVQVEQNSEQCLQAQAPDIRPRLFLAAHFWHHYTGIEQ
jgi:hypothetical protein